MPLTILDESRFSEGTPYASNLDNTDYTVLRDVFIRSTADDGYVFDLTGNNNDVEVRGTVWSENDAVRLGNALSDVGQHLHVTATGRLIGDGYGLVSSGSSLVENEGEIRGAGAGLVLGVDSTGTVRIVNAGVIEAYLGGISIGGTTGSVATLINTGIIRGGSYSYAGSTTEGRITNAGSMIGDVFLSQGNDRFDDRGGTVRGEVLGSGGDDTFLTGRSAETFDGGDGFDTLIFASARGARVLLTDADGSTNTGWARGDSYTDFERVLGSDGGNDVLGGNAGANTLEGRGGADILRGRQGDDVLWGGAGRDTLTGGAGDDSFVYASPKHGGDRVADFGSGAGNNDSVRIDASGFGAGLTAGDLDAFQFRARGDNRAQDGNDRFIFRTTDETLWFDRNGSSSGGLTLLADLQDGAVVTYTDVYLF